MSGDSDQQPVSSNIARALGVLAAQTRDAMTAVNRWDVTDGGSDRVLRPMLAELHDDTRQLETATQNLITLSRARLLAIPSEDRAGKNARYYKATLNRATMRRRVLNKVKSEIAASSRPTRDMNSSSRLPALPVDEYMMLAHGLEKIVSQTSFGQ